MSEQRFEIVDLIADNGMDWGVRCDSDLVAQFRDRDDAELFIRAAANGPTPRCGWRAAMTDAAPCMGTRGEDIEVWFDIYAGRRPAPPELGIHDEFMRCLDDNAGKVGVWTLDANGLIRLVADGTEHIYSPNGYVTAGGYKFYQWPD